MRSKIVLLMLGLLGISLASPYLLLMDASGSMDEYIDNEQTKMSAAKKAAKNFVDQSSGEVGLMVFDDCDYSGNPESGGIRLEQDFTSSKSTMKSRIDSLSAYGDTPIADALEEAKNYLQNSRERGTIILITDGEETCGGDPVEVAEDIYREGTGTIHVVGFMIGGTAEEYARDIAYAGGGRYYSAESSIELEEALVDITDSTDGNGVICCPVAALLLLLPFLSLLSNRS